MNRHEWHVHSDIAYGDGVSVYIGSRTESVTATLTVEPKEPGAWREPTLRLDRAHAQQLINGLWQAGFRPKDGAGALAHVETLKAHLDDLRTVAFHALKIKTPSR